jgi:hypothetical protein
MSANDTVFCQALIMNALQDVASTRCSRGSTARPAIRGRKVKKGVIEIHFLNWVLSNFVVVAVVVLLVPGVLRGTGGCLQPGLGKKNIKRDFFAHSLGQCCIRVFVPALRL